MGHAPIDCWCVTHCSRAPCCLPRHTSALSRRAESPFDEFDHGSQAEAAGNQDRYVPHRERISRYGSDARHNGALPRSLDYGCGLSNPHGGVDERCSRRRRSERHGIDITLRDGEDQFYQLVRRLDRVDAIDRGDDDLCPTPAQGLRGQGKRLTMLLQNDTTAREIPVLQVSEDIRKAFRSGRPIFAKTAAPQYARRFGARARISAPAIAAVSSPPSPHVSAASNHTLMPMPVVARNRSMGRARTARVISRKSSRSTMEGARDSAGAQSTRAPRRSNRPICSCALRTAVTPTRLPLNGKSAFVTSHHQQFSPNLLAQSVVAVLQYFEARRFDGLTR